MGTTSMEVLHDNFLCIPVIICPYKGQIYKKIFMKARVIDHKLNVIKYPEALNKF